MKILVTGATGFVGSHIARQLAEQGAVLRLLVRSTSRTENIDAIHAERMVGDLEDAASLRKAVQGCEFVFHVAADYRLWAPRPQAMYRANVEGTRAMIEAAAQAGVRRLVYTSSVATMGFRKDGEPCDEDSPVGDSDMIGHYKRSKFMAEKIALQAGRGGGSVVVVNPSAPVGEQDIKPTPTGRIVLDFLNRKFPAYTDTGLNLVDVEEVARGHIAAMELARPGERYILGGENLTLKQVLDKLSAISGIPSPSVKVPYAVALGFAVFDTFFTGVIRQQTPRATIDAVRMGRKKMYVSSAKAEHDLGWRMTPVDAALRRATEWFVAHGYVRQPLPALSARPQNQAAT